LEKYKKVFDSKLHILNEYEFNDIVTLENVLSVLQRAEMVMQIVGEIEKQIAELGEDGRLVEMQLEELIGGVEKEEELIIKDYSLVEGKNAQEIIEEISKLSYEELLNEQNLAKILGYDSFSDFEEVAVYTRGYRILNKIPRMPSNIVENLIQGFESFQHIIDASIEELDNIEGIGEVRARNIKNSLNRMQEQFVFDNIVD
jgi:diadenylate cyclase